MKRESLSFFDWLQLMFIFLKLHGDIDWSWWCVLLPAIIIVTLLILGKAFEK